MRYAAHPRTLDAFRRAGHGLSPRALAPLLAFLGVFALSRAILGLPGTFTRAAFVAWLLDLVIDFGLVSLVVLVAVTAVTVAQNLGPARGLRRVAVLAVAVAVGTLAGLALRAFVIRCFDTDVQGWDAWLAALPGAWVEYAFIGACYAAIAEFIRRRQASVAAMHRAELDRLALEREMDSARMQVMQAQIEPHFLFNTLANVRRLYQTDARAARTMLDNLMRYFEIALPRMRHASTDLAHEAELVDAYLRIHQIRMGSRLSFALDIPAELRATAVPPMMLLTLVENAIKHGVNPRLDGGAISVRAYRDAQTVRLEVADSGGGFEQGSGGGMGLANIRARLAAEFGAAASLALRHNQPRGVVATLTLPTATDPA